MWQLPQLLQGQPLVQCRDEVKRSYSLTGSPSLPARAVLSLPCPFPGQQQVVVGGEDAGAGSRLEASPRLPSAAGEPCGELAAVARPSPAGDRAAVAETAGRLASWQAGSSAAVVNQCYP